MSGPAAAAGGPLLGWAAAERAEPEAASGHDHGPRHLPHLLLPHAGQLKQGKLFQIVCNFTLYMAEYYHFLAIVTE